MRRLLALAALAATLVLSACQGLPSTGPVIEGRRLGEPINEPVLIGAQGPFDGATPEQVVRGFIRAGEDSDETRQAGKSFLSPRSVDLWRWTSQDVVVYDSDEDITVRTVGDEKVEVTAAAVATVSPAGRYTEVPAGTTVKTTFGLTKVGGEWRLELPTSGFGLWLDTNAFDRLFTNRFVYFVTPTDRLLVPDSRWFPNVSGLATTLARAQLGPVPAYLAGSVVTGVPANTTLAVNAVPVDNGLAQVNLSARALDADPDDRTAMWAQLTATLSQVSSVTSVGLAAVGTGLDLPGGRTSVAAASELGYEVVTPKTYELALLRRRETLAPFDPRYIPDSSPPRRNPPPQTQEPYPARIPEGWERLALSADSSEIAAIGGDRRQMSRWHATKPFILVRPFATSLTRPTYDRSGFLWVAGAEPSGAFRVFTLDSTSTDLAAVPKPVSAPWLKDRKVVSLAVAADGARVLVVTSDRQDGDVRLGLSGVVRSPNGEPRALDAPLRQAQPLTLIRDVLWLSDASYAVLGRIAPTEAVRPWVGTIGGGLDGVRRHGSSDPKDLRLAPVANGVSMTTVGGPRGLVVITLDGRVRARAGATWREIERGTDLLVPGR